MTVSFDASPDDIRALYHFHTFETPAGRAQTRRARIVRLILAAILSVGVGMLAQGVGAAAMLTGLLTFALLGAWIALAHRSLRKRDVDLAFGQWARSDAGRQFAGPRTVELLPGGLHWTSGAGEHLARYSTLTDIGVTADHVFVTWSGMISFVIPRRAFATNAAFELFVETLKASRTAQPNAIAATNSGNTRVGNWWTQGKVTIESESTPQRNRLGSGPPP